jgi:hypothetical protein
MRNMRIEKNKRICKCGVCKKPISSKYRVSHQNRLFHLSCFKPYLEEWFKKYKEGMAEINKPKYKKIMILEELEK